MNQPQELFNVEPEHIDAKIEIKDLTRQIVLTFNVHDDETFAVFAKEAILFRDELKKEFAAYKKTKIIK